MKMQLVNNEAASQSCEYVCEYMLEDETKMVLQFSGSSVTWEAWNKEASIIGTSKLIAKGFKAMAYMEGNAWCIRAMFN